MRAIPRVSKPSHRAGVVMVLFAMILVVLIGLMGLVIDGGFLMSSHRQAQNTADAAALAAAFEKYRGRSNSDARTAADDFVDQNGLTTLPALVDGTSFNIPPSTGPYAGNSKYVEVILTVPVQSLFIQILGGPGSNDVTARAVAGFEAVAAGEGVMVLDRAATPGLSVSGGGRIRVNGRVTVNSEGGGVDEVGVTVAPASDLPTGSNALTAQVQGNNQSPPQGIYATWLDVVGGVQSTSVANIYPYAPPGQGPPVGEPSPLHARALPEPDPLIQLPTPTTGSGVDATDYAGSNNYRGSVAISSNNATGDIGNGYVAGRNSKITNADVTGNNLPQVLDNTGTSVFTGVSPAAFQAGDVILYPGIYGSVSITGGRTFFVPGIYVLSPKQNTANVFSVGGSVNGSTTIVGRGVMFYNTGNSYNPANGNPDANDGEAAPASNNNFGDGTSYVGGFTVSKDVHLSPIDTTKYAYATYYDNARAVSAEFDGMLFYQRRRNASTFSITGNASDGSMTGTVYAKWALFQLAGSGSYDAQFIVGSLAASGGADITILAAGSQRGRANQVFLVE